eukprot:CAMPEP_0119004612 /NCGR_PEP_ID=MMETSP1176-20130426/1246_1 /TAXON_ID=265551 /ORGANISM="Synedropsis recta cf, Strain CCMP1620" /LENGTH=293 /DNA_ID=CAMNT_0006956341 /DNA_START=194 /DNA_END=1075 /DNA_ORIENTATION=-
MGEPPKPSTDENAPAKKRKASSDFVSNDNDNNNSKNNSISTIVPAVIDNAKHTKGSTSDVQLEDLAVPCFQWVLSEEEPIEESPVDGSRFLAFPSAYPSESSSDELKDFFCQINVATVPAALQEQFGVKSGLFQFKLDLSDPYEGKMRLIPESDFGLLRTVEAAVNDDVAEREPKSIIGWTEGVDYPSRYISEGPLDEALAAACEERQFPQCDKMGGWTHPQQWDPGTLEELKDCRAIFEFTDEGDEEAQKSTGEFMTECLGDGGSGSMKWTPKWAAALTNKFSDAGFFAAGG